jgi:hypothetical protein
MQRVVCEWCGIIGRRVHVHSVATRSSVRRSELDNVTLKCTYVGIESCLQSTHSIRVISLTLPPTECDVLKGRRIFHIFFYPLMYVFNLA